MNEYFKNGFVKRAADYGISEQYANQLLKSAGPLDGMGNIGQMSVGQNPTASMLGGIADRALGGSDPAGTLFNKSISLLQRPNAMNINSMAKGGMGALQSMIPQFKQHIANNSGQYNPELVSRVAPTIDDGYLARQVKP